MVGLAIVDGGRGATGGATDGPARALVGRAVKRRAFDVPKLAHLRRLLVPVAPGADYLLAVGMLERLWRITAAHAPQGDVGRLTDAQIVVDGMHFTLRPPSDVIAMLVESRWLDPHPVHRLLVHDWHEHCDQGTVRALQRAGQPFLSLPEIADDQSRTAGCTYKRKKLDKTSFVQKTPLVRTNGDVRTTDDVRTNAPFDPPVNDAPFPSAFNGGGPGRRRKRLPQPWPLPDAGRDYYVACGLPLALLDVTHTEFCAYWWGEGSAHPDWLATWKNRCLRLATELAAKGQLPPPPPPTDGLAAEILATLGERPAT